MITAPDFTREMLVEVKGVSKKFCATSRSPFGMASDIGTHSGYVRLAIKQVDVSMFRSAPLAEA